MLAADWLLGLNVIQVLNYVRDFAWTELERGYRRMANEAAFGERPGQVIDGKEQM